MVWQWGCDTFTVTENIISLHTVHVHVGNLTYLDWRRNPLCPVSQIPIQEQTLHWTSLDDESPLMPTHTRTTKYHKARISTQLHVWETHHIHVLIQFVHVQSWDFSKSKVSIKKHVEDICLPTIAINSLSNIFRSRQKPSFRVDGGHYRTIHQKQNTNNYMYHNKDSLGPLATATSIQKVPESRRSRLPQFLHVHLGFLS